MADLAIIILTYNEERHIGRALSCVESIAKEIFVIDSYSSDRTIEIAHAHGAVILENKFVNYARQFQWALENAPITTTWVMRLDADEIIEPDLASEIAEKLPGLSGNVAGINLKRKHVFLNRWIRHGGRYPLLLLRIWRRDHGRIEDRWMDEHMIVWGGRTVTFDGNFTDHNLNDISFFVEKHNRYATREAIDNLNQRLGFFVRDDTLTAKGTSHQASIKRAIKEKFYNRMPFYIAALIYFLHRYFIQLGFLDGVEGLCYHFLQGFWYRFLVGAKVLELERATSHLAAIEDIRYEVTRITGLKV